MAANEEEQVLPEDVPVVMPELPLRLVVNTAQQFKALGEPLRWRIFDSIRYRPATAKQIADKLQVAPGTIGHHLQVLESVGLVKVVARRLTHGIIAKYYTRTARIFEFAFPPEVAGDSCLSLDLITLARDEMAERVQADGGENGIFATSSPSARITPERLQYYQERLKALANEFLSEAADPQGQVYKLFMTLFEAPPYMQVADHKPEQSGELES